MEQDITQQDSPKKTNIKKAVIYTLIVIIIAAITGGGVYWWENRQLEKQKSNLQGQIDSSKASISKLEADKKALEDQIQKSTSTTVTQLNDTNLVRQAVVAKCGADIGRQAAVSVFTVNLQQDNFMQVSYVCSGLPEGPTAIYKKVGTVWTEVWSGLGPIDSQTRTSTGIPSSMPGY